MAEEAAPAPDQPDIRSLVARLARPSRDGGAVIEHAAILAEGSSASAMLAWITDHDGRPETSAPAASSGGGLHGGRPSAAGSRARAPQRYVLPPGALA